MSILSYLNVAINEIGDFSWISWNAIYGCISYVIAMNLHSHNGLTAWERKQFGHLNNIGTYVDKDTILKNLKMIGYPVVRIELSSNYCA